MRRYVQVPIGASENDFLYDGKQADRPHNRDVQDGVERQVEHKPERGLKSDRCSGKERKQVNSGIAKQSRTDDGDREIAEVVIKPNEIARKGQGQHDLEYQNVDDRKHVKETERALAWVE